MEATPTGLRPLWERWSPIVLLAGAIGLTVALQQPWPIGIYTVYVVVTALWQERRYWRDYVRMYRSIRLRHVLLALPTVLVVLNLAILTFRLPFEVLQLSWLQAAGEAGTNSIAIPFAWEWFAPLWAALLLAALPILALVEERIFRRGLRTTTDVLRRSLLFGAAHMIVGVPLGVALIALPLGGLMFSREYLRALKQLGAADLPPHAWEDDDQAYAVEEAAIFASGVLHLTYNLLLVLTVLGLWLWGDLLPAPLREWLGT